MAHEHVNLEHARYDDQRKVMQKSVEDDECPFCLEALHKYHKQPILAESEHWVVTTNQWPYAHTDAHFLLIAKHHAETVTDLPLEAYTDLGRQVKWLARKYQLAYGGLAMRFGDTAHTGATVNHLHVHIIQAAKDLPEGEKVKFKFSR